jgi:Family of unknown function (DUF6879)
VATEPVAYGLLRSAEHSAAHMEMRDSYTPDDPDWLDWQAGRRFDPEERWASWSELIRATVARGVSVRRIRLVSEPVTDYIRFEYDVTAEHNIAAGEEVRCLPRPAAAGLLVPCSDFWVLDGQVVLWNHFAGDGSWVGEERCDDLAIAKLCESSFNAAWDRAIPHKAYQPA